MKVGPLLVREIDPAGAIPESAWADVVRRLGHLVLATATTVRGENGRLSIAYAVCLATVDRVRAVLREHGATFGEPDRPAWLEDTPPVWLDETPEAAAQPWERDGDWWKG